jgi:hypothetical protein
MAAGDSRSGNDDTTFPMMRVEDSTAKVGIPTARQSNSTGARVSRMADT